MQIVGWTIRVALLMCIVVVGSASAQDEAGNAGPFFVHLTAGMGIDEISTSGLSDYINALTDPVSGQEVSGFATAVEFFIGPEVRITPDWSVGVEYSYLMKTFTVIDPSGFSRWDFATNVHLPSVVAHYVIAGKRYWVKAGGGPGYYLGRMVQSNTMYGGSQTYTARGPGFKLEAIANTEFDEHFWGSIGVDMRWCAAGTLVNGSGAAASHNGNTAKLDFFTAGIKFGVTVQF
jgi:hypothetical protein